MSSPIPEVDYAATARRPAWSELPAQVHRLVESLCGTAVEQAGAPSGSGFTSGYAGLVRLADRREVFVKAGGPKNNAHILPSYRREADVLEVLGTLPPGLPVPRLLATGETETVEGTYRVLVTDPVDGRMPGQPWTAADLAAVHRTCLTCAQLLTPPPDGLELPALADQMTEDAGVMSLFTRLATSETTLTWGQPAWVLARADELAEILARTPDALRGNTAGHADLRADNLLVDPAGTAWLFDWNWLSVGPAWTDFVGILPLARADGIDADAWLATSPLTEGVDPDDIDTWLAVIAAYMLDQADQPVWTAGPAHLRVHQRRYARTFLDWLGARRRWAG
jgi:hypothetical protein